MKRHLMADGVHEDLAGRGQGQCQREEQSLTRLSTMLHRRSHRAPLLIERGAEINPSMNTIELLFIEHIITIIQLAFRPKGQREDWHTESRVARGNHRDD